MGRAGAAQGPRTEVTEVANSLCDTGNPFSLWVSVSPPLQWAVEAGDLAPMSFVSWVLGWCLTSCMWLWRPAAESPARRVASDSNPCGSLWF